MFSKAKETALFFIILCFVVISFAGCVCPGPSDLDSTPEDGIADTIKRITGQ